MSATDDRAILELERPDAKLLIYYVLRSIVLGPFFFVALLPLYFRYHTLHYRFDQEGISMGWGILFRREIHLTYSRIQDIHLVANFVERWLGLARVQIQTASGSAKAEMTIEGLLQADAVRDFLYSRMRGARDAREGGDDPARRVLRPGLADYEAPPDTADVPSAASIATASELAAVLAEVAAELRGVRLALEAAGRRPDPHDAPAGTGRPK